MITSYRTVMATAERAEVEADRYQREECDPHAWLGVDAPWCDRRLFAWAYLRASTRRSIATYGSSTTLSDIMMRCDTRIAELVAAAELGVVQP